MQPLSVTPIGVIRTPFPDRASAPRQPTVAREAAGTIELFPGHNYHHALEDLEAWSHIWVLFWFHLNDNWQPKVRPPRSDQKKGLFSTRSPYRPNPIGLSVVELCAVKGLCLSVRGVDMIDGTPVLDIKPYLPYADRVDTTSGWLGGNASDEAADPGPHYQITWSALATEQAQFIEVRSGALMVTPIVQRLAAGPGHHYRRIWNEGDDLVLAYRSWRVRAKTQGDTISVSSLHTGYTDVTLAPATRSRWPEDDIALHREYVARFG